MNRPLIALAAIACIAGALALAACSSSSEPGNAPQEGTSGDTYAVALPAVPAKLGEDDAEAWLKTLDENLLDADFLASLSTFSYKTASAALSEPEASTSKDPEKGANSTYSPVSLYYAFALATQGAAGQTATEMNALLGATDPAAVAQNSGNLFRVMASDPYSTTALANSIWMSDNDPFKQSFVDTATQQFYATPFAVKFGTPETDEAIASWIKDNTRGTIDPQVETTSDQLMSIINTVYFKDGWVIPFDVENTKDDTFHAADGDKTVSFMMQKFDDPREYVQTDRYTRASLGFAGGATMSFVLPAEGVTAGSILSDAALLEESLTAPATDLARITFTLPKATFDTSFDLIPPLKSLGLETPFSDQADFSNLTEQPAFISLIKQESHIAWDENGAEASAYTNIGISKMSLMPEDVPAVDFKLDRPFLFAITSAQGAPLFIGVCGNPAA
ncbi:MAG: serpin family protein [Gordonibacter sp.]